MKFVSAIIALFALLAFPHLSPACSMVRCTDKGLELRRNFVVRVTHAGRPLPGVNVWITNVEDQDHKFFSGVTTGDGIVRVTNLPPGDYWLGAELLGIYAGTECFHVGTGCLLYTSYAADE